MFLCVWLGSTYGCKLDPPGKHMGPISHPPKPWFVTVGCRVDVSHQEWESKGPSPKASTKGSMVVKSSLKAVYFLCLGGPGGIWWKVGWYFPRRWVPQTGQIAPQSIAVIIHTTGACWGLLCCDAGLTWKKSRWVSIQTWLKETPGCFLGHKLYVSLNAWKAVGYFGSFPLKSKEPIGVHWCPF